MTEPNPDIPEGLPEKYHDLYKHFTLEPLRSFDESSIAALRDLAALRLELIRSKDNDYTCALEADNAKLTEENSRLKARVEELKNET